MTYDPTKHVLIHPAPPIYTDSGFIQLDVMELDSGDIIGLGNQSVDWFLTQANAWLQEMGEIDFFTLKDVVTKHAIFYYDPENGHQSEWTVSWGVAEVPKKYQTLVHIISV